MNGLQALVQQRLALPKELRVPVGAFDLAAAVGHLSAQISACLADDGHIDAKERAAIANDLSATLVAVLTMAAALDMSSDTLIDLATTRLLNQPQRRGRRRGSRRR